MGKGKGFSIKQFLRALQRLNLTLKPQWWYSEGHQGCIYVLASSEYPPKHTGWIPHCYQKSLNPACSQWMWLQPWSVVTFGFWITPDTGDAIFSKLTQIILPECPKVPECSYLSSPRNWNCNLFIHFRHEGTCECAHTKGCAMRGWQDRQGEEGFRNTLTVHCSSWEDSIHSIIWMLES